MPNQEQRIRERAYDLWEQAGRPSDREREHWEQACREVRADQEGDDPVAVDEVPAGDDSRRTVRADIDRLTPTEATAATLRRSAASGASEPEGRSRRPL